MKGSKQMGTITLPPAFLAEFGDCSVREPPAGWLCAADVAKRMGCTTRHAQHRLHDLRKSGKIEGVESKPIGGQRRTWFYNIDSVKS